MLLQTGISCRPTGFTPRGASYSIILPSGDVSLVRQEGWGGMVARNFTSHPANSGTLGGSGSQHLTVGVILYSVQQQESGSYLGSFNVTVDYN